MPDTRNAINMEQYVLSHFDEAIEHRYISAYCQPVIRTTSGQICGMEALARWNDPELGLLMPDQFIGVLERHRRIHELDSYIIREVCAGFRSAVNSNAYVPISINLSRLDYELCDIFEVVEAAVRENKVLRSYLCIEITESTLNSNETLMRNYIERFQKAGYAVWMDDFGSGYSSLNVLKDYCFDELKIDMKFLSDFHPRSKRILAAIVNMAKQIGIQTLSEGVETEEQFEYLRNIGCEKVQGNLFGAAMPYAECVRYAEERGLTWEAPVHRKYYDDLGRVNVLSATPFLSLSDQKDPGTGREMNSIPLAVLELRGDLVYLLNTNQAFDTTASGMDWRAVFGVVGTRSDCNAGIPLTQLSLHLKNLLEETRSAGKGTMHFVNNDEYYELKTKRLAAYDDRAGILMRILNLSRGAEMARQAALDEGARQIYSVYDRVSVLDLKAGTASALYLDSQEKELFRPKPADQAAREYADGWVFPEDRERYMSFTDTGTLGERVDRSGTGYVAAYFRIRAYHGAYVWKCFTAVRVRETLYYLLVRDMEAEIRELESFYGARPQSGQGGEGGIPPAVLWDNVRRNSPLKFFWKDKERRFKGASQSFLSFYGFESTKDILGKTDEEMGWHIHPKHYRDIEWKVLREGVTARDIPGTCIARGENRSIIASKMPIYNADGEIEGLMGYFTEVSGGEAADGKGVTQNRVDALSGLLNTRGLDEEQYAYRDEYELRQTDFARIDVSIEDLPEINQRYGYDFGDSVIRKVADELLRRCGRAASVGRITGSQFAVFRQFKERAEIEELTTRIRNISAETQVVDGIPFTIYLTVGMALYSESGSLVQQEFLAQLRRATDDVGSVSRTQLRETMMRVFYMYEKLPLAYAVYKVLSEEDDAVILYVNQRFAHAVNRTAEELVGERVSRMFPMRGHAWLDMAHRAANGEEITDRFYYEYLNRNMTLTANQVIGSGYCAFTYQISERL